MAKEIVKHGKTSDTRKSEICPKFKGGKKLPDCEGYKWHARIFIK